LLYCVLQWWRPQAASDEHGNASMPGVAMVPVAAGVGVGEGAGMGAGAGAGA
jgi:hypothetical protein